MRRSAHSVALTGLYTALCVVIGFLMAPVPNVELITLFIFAGGYLFGKKYGLIIGGTAEFLFSAFNPWGSGLAFPPLLAAQVFSMMIVGLSGGLLSSILPAASSRRVKAAVFGASGLALTVLFHATLALFSFRFAGFSLEQLRITVIAGLSFSLWHIGLNALFFAAFMPVLIRVSQRFGESRDERLPG